MQARPGAGRERACRTPPPPGSALSQSNSNQMSGAARHLESHSRLWLFNSTWSCAPGRAENSCFPGKASPRRAAHGEAREPPSPARDAPQPGPHLAARPPRSRRAGPGRTVTCQLPHPAAPHPESPGHAFKSRQREEEPPRHPSPEKESKKAVPPGGGRRGQPRSQRRHTTPLPAPTR